MARHHPMKYLEQILAHARAGRPVFPCKKDKSPYTKSGFKDATTDENKIRAWWGTWPDALIGMPTGEASGIDVLDIDAKKGKSGYEHVPDWDKLSPVIARTVNGGAHLYFKASGVKCTSDQVARGVDTRGDGGYVIIPPSPGYAWKNGSDLTTVPPFPDAYRLPTVKSEASVTGDVPPHILASFLADNPNADLGWDDWNNRGMAIWHETKGSEQGRAMFHAWSSKSRKYDSDTTNKRWDHWGKSPPNGAVGAGTIIFHAGKFRGSNSGPGTTSQIVSLRKRLDDEPTYFVSLLGLEGELECKMSQLWEYGKFQMLAAKKWDHVFGMMKRAHWREALRQALQEVVKVPRSVATAAIDVAWYETQEFLTNNLRAQFKDQILLGRPWEDEESEKNYFRIGDLMEFLWGKMPDRLPRTQVAQWIEDDWGGGTCELEIKPGVSEIVYWIPSNRVRRQRTVAAPRVPNARV